MLSILSWLKAGQRVSRASPTVGGAQFQGTACRDRADRLLALQLTLKSIKRLSGNSPDNSIQPAHPERQFSLHHLAKLISNPDRDLLDHPARLQHLAS